MGGYGYDDDRDRLYSDDEDDEPRVPILFTYDDEDEGRAVTLP